MAATEDERHAPLEETWRWLEGTRDFLPLYGGNMWLPRVWGRIIHPETGESKSRVSVNLII